MRLIQLYASGLDELWEFDDEFSDEQIQAFYKNYEESSFDSFEEYLQEIHSEIHCERKYVDEIYV